MLRTPPESPGEAAEASAISRREVAVLCGIFALALTLRLAYLAQVWDIPFLQFPVSDAESYDAWAQQIASGRWRGEEVFYQAPLYPYFLALIYSVAGRSLLAAHLVQMVMGAASCVVIGLAARSFFGRSAGWVAALLLALYAPAIFFDGILGKTGLALFLLSLWIYLLARLSRRPVPRLAMGNGFVLGLLALTRENALIFAPAIPVWLLCSGAAPRALRIRSAAAFALGLLLVLGSVGVRNQIVGGSFALTTSQMGTNFYIGNNPAATGLYAPLIAGRHTPVHEASDAANLAEEALGRELTPGEVSGYWFSRGLEFLREQPGAAAGLFARKAVLTWHDFEIPDTEDIYVYAEWSSLLRVLLWFFSFGVLAPLAAAGAVLARGKESRAWVLWGLAGLYTVGVAVFITFARFRFPLVPLLAPFAAFALVEGTRRVRSGEGASTSAMAALIVLLAMTSFTRLPWIDREVFKAAAYTNLGGILLGQGLDAQAEPHLQSALALDPESPDLQLHLALLRFREDRWGDAEAHLRRAQAVDADDHRVYFLLARVLWKLDRRAEALEARLRANQLHPNQGRPHRPKVHETPLLDAS